MLMLMGTLTCVLRNMQSRRFHLSQVADVVSSPQMVKMDWQVFQWFCSEVREENRTECRDCLLQRLWSPKLPSPTTEAQSPLNEFAFLSSLVCQS